MSENNVKRKGILKNLLSIRTGEKQVRQKQPARIKAEVWEYPAGGGIADGII